MAAVVIKIAAVVNNKVITFNTLGRSEEPEKKMENRNCIEMTLLKVIIC